MHQLNKELKHTLTLLQPPAVKELIIQQGSAQYNCKQIEKIIVASQDNSYLE
jgi:hypothetical protein